MRKLAQLLSILAAFSAVTLRTDATASTERNKEILSVSHRLSVDKVHPGTTFQVAVILRIAEGWHLQAAKPTFEYLIPTQLTLEAEAGVELSEVSYPPPKQILFAGDKIDVLEGQSVLRFTVRLPKDFALGEHLLRGKLQSQACDDEVCLAPQTTPIAISFEVVSADTPTQPINSDWFPTQSSILSPQSSSSNEVARLFEERGTLLALIGIFFIGLALNLTPCVYPMLSVTVSIFGGQQDTNTARVFAKAVVYVLGIATMYSALGTLAALTGELFGGMLQNRWVLAGIAVLFVLLAASMFGFYELRLPSSWMSKMGATTSAGFAGVYLSGLVVGIFAAPCVGPPIIALLALVGAKGDPWFGFGSFFVLSLGLGAPYLVLGTFTGLLQKLPRSGVWMEWVKKVFGVVMIGVAAFYLSLGFAADLLQWILPFTLILGGVYLGFINRSGADKPLFRKVKWAFGGVAALAGVVVLATAPKESLEWQPYDSGMLADAKQAGKPVILDFYADWCIPCHELDRKTFTHPEVIDALKNHVRLKVDLTNDDSPEAQAIMQEFGIQGVPTIIRLGPDGNEIPDSRVVGFLPPRQFLRQMGLL